MPFCPPTWLPQLPDVPDAISVETFLFDERYGRHAAPLSRPPFVDGLTGKAYTVHEVKRRVDHLARGLAAELGFEPHAGTEWDKAVACYSINTIDYLTLAWAVHRLGGVVCCINASCNAGELATQLRDSGAKAIFTCLPLLATTLTGIETVGTIPKERVFLYELTPSATPGSSGGGGSSSSGHKTLQQLIDTGTHLPNLQPADSFWAPGDGHKRIAFVCYSSGTSGLPKGVMLAHQNLIANVMQFTAHQHRSREAVRRELGLENYTIACLGLLPMSHLYGLLIISLMAMYRGDSVIVLPRYDLEQLLQCIQRFRIAHLWVVPPMVIDMAKQAATLRRYDLSSVRVVFAGAAPLTRDTIRDLLRVMPDVCALQGYGLTESGGVVCGSDAADVWPGSSGWLVPGTKLRIFTPDGDEEITEYNRPGELWVHSPSLVPGYLNNAQATTDTFIIAKDDGLRYLKTGDEGLVAKSETGVEHVFITDRIKELIKVKSHQVAPAELEGHLLTHPAVSDCVVVGVPSPREGEVPKAFVVRAASAAGSSDDALIQSILDHVARHKSDHKRLRGGVEFIDAVPKSPAGKILRRVMRDRERAKMAAQGAKL